MEPNVRQALGIIETRGYTPLVTAVDGAIKAAQVSLQTSHLVGGGLATATVTGDVGAVRAAMDAATAVINNLGAEGMTHVIARPAGDVWKMLEQDGLKVDREPEGGNSSDGGSGAPTSGPASEGNQSAEVSVRPDQNPAVRQEAQVPAVREESEVPAVREEAEVPAIKEEAGLPMVQENHVDAVGPGGSSQPGNGSGPEKPVNKAPAKKKPRKTGGKK